MWYDLRVWNVVCPLRKGPEIECVYDLRAGMWRECDGFWLPGCPFAEFD